MAINEELGVHAETPVEYSAAPTAEQPRAAGPVPELKSFRRTKSDTRAEDAHAKVAVIVCHGMGQQVPYETIDMIAGSLLSRDSGKPVPSADSHVRQVKFGDDLLGRAEITLTREDQNGKDQKREVHIYEAYWAPLTAGKVTLMDVVWFLLKAAGGGLWTTLTGALKFKRWMFGDFKQMKVRVRELLYLAFALKIMVAVSLLYFAFAWSVLAYLLGGGIQSFGTELVQDLRTTLVAFAALLGVGGIILLALALVRSRLTPGFLAGLLTKLILLVALMVLAGTCGLGFCVFILYGHHVLQTFGSPEPGLLIGFLGWIYDVVVGFERWVISMTQSHSRTWFYLSAAALGIAFAVGRSFLIEYMGDVTAYVAAHTASKFYELRTQIQQVAFKVFNAVYGAQTADGQREYDTIVVTGHSLGSVLTYDTLNAFINYDALLQNHSLNVLGRTPMLVTFGSPLDKTAFLFRDQVKNAIFREALAATKQPMILDYDARPERWINIFNRADWISGSLDYYDDPQDAAHLSKHVQNIEDREGFFPLLAHTEYPGHPELREALMQGIFRVPR